MQRERDNRLALDTDARARATGVCGYHVDSARECLGRVQELLYGAERVAPAALLVRSTRFRARLALVPVEEIEQVRASAQRIVLRPSWRSASVELPKRETARLGSHPRRLR